MPNKFNTGSSPIGRKPTRTKSRNSVAQEFNATTVGDGQWTLGTLHGSAPRIEARDLDNEVVGVFPTRAEAVVAIIAARAKCERGAR